VVCDIAEFFNLLATGYQFGVNPAGIGMEYLIDAEDD
jgi:hypothetical protein